MGLGLSPSHPRHPDMHHRTDYRVPDEASTGAGKLCCLFLGAVFAPALPCDLHDRLTNEQLSGQGANFAQMLTVFFWMALVACCLLGLAQNLAWVLAGMLLPSLLLQALLRAGRSRFPVWNREKAYVFPPGSLPQPITEESACAFARLRLPPLCCAAHDMRVEAPCLHRGDVPGFPRNSLHVTITFRHAPQGWRKVVAENLLCRDLPFVWVLSLLDLLRGLPPTEAATLLGLYLMLILMRTPLQLAARRHPVTAWQHECLEGLAIGLAILGSTALLACVLLGCLW